MVMLPTPEPQTVPKEDARRLRQLGVDLGESVEAFLSSLSALKTAVGNFDWFVEGSDPDRLRGMSTDASVDLARRAQSLLRELGVDVDGNPDEGEPIGYIVRYIPQEIAELQDLVEFFLERFAPTPGD